MVKREKVVMPRLERERESSPPMEPVHSLQQSPECAVENKTK
jgi:hypothetical protein